MPKLGDKVTFHMIPMHLCGGGKEITEEVKQRRADLGLPDDTGAGCRCAWDAAVHLEAEVIAVLEPEQKMPQALELEVDMPPEIVALGYATRQSHSYQATTNPPESGSWTLGN